MLRLRATDKAPSRPLAASRDNREAFAFVPDSSWLGRDQYAVTEATGLDEVVLEAWRHDRAAQILDKVHLRLRTKPCAFTRSRCAIRGPQPRSSMH